MQVLPRRLSVEVTSPPARIRVWDLPTRIFHWSLAALLVFSFATGKAGGAWMDWHLKSGYCILALLVFRLAWGFLGGRTARFAHFVRGPRAALEFARATLAGRHPVTLGHNPLGGWMVLLMLLVLAGQAVSGLFADDEISTQGPLAAKVSNAFVSRMTALHYYFGWAIVALAAVHVAAVAVYQWAWKVDLVGPMTHGWKTLPPELRAHDAAGPSLTLAGILLAVAAFLVYALVVIYPRG